MRFLVDNALSPRVALGLLAMGHDARHVRELELGASSDSVVFVRAVVDERVLVSADADFGVILARRGARRPSVILFRHGAERAPDRQIRLLRDVLPRVKDALTAGAVVVLEPSRIRIRPLPLSGNRA